MIRLIRRMIRHEPEPKLKSKVAKGTLGAYYNWK